MTCPQCGQDNPTVARFCNGCGARLAAACPACGQPNPSGSRFCNGCGARLMADDGAAHTRGAGVYIPAYLAERILTSRTALEGERKQVTVLFADLKGSMELLAERDPEDARKLLDPVLERMMDAVHRYEGTVNQVMGDGIMALFGAPLAHEDHAVRACYAAVRMQESVKHYAVEVQRTKGVPLHIRVGLNAGEVVVRSIGSDLHMDYTAVGQTTQLDARIEQMAMPGSILITAEVLRLAEGHIQVNALRPVPIDGLHAPVEIFGDRTEEAWVHTRRSIQAPSGAEVAAEGVVANLSRGPRCTRRTRIRGRSQAACCAVTRSHGGRHRSGGRTAVRPRREERASLQRGPMTRSTGGNGDGYGRVGTIHLRIRGSLGTIACRLDPGPDRHCDGCPRSGLFV